MLERKIIFIGLDLCQIWNTEDSNASAASNRSSGDAGEGVLEERHNGRYCFTTSSKRGIDYCESDVAVDQLPYYFVARYCEFARTPLHFSPARNSLCHFSVLIVLLRVELFENKRNIDGRQIDACEILICQVKLQSRWIRLKQRYISINEIFMYNEYRLFHSGLVRIILIFKFHNSWNRAVPQIFNFYIWYYFDHVCELSLHFARFKFDIRYIQLSINVITPTQILRNWKSSANRLESATRSLKISAPQRVVIESWANEISASCLTDLKLQSVHGAIKLDAKTLFMKGLKTASPSQGHSSREQQQQQQQQQQHSSRTSSHQSQRDTTIYQLCACANGKLFLARSEGTCQADKSIC